MRPDFLDGLIESLESGLNSGNISLDHRDYILIKELYHCKPSDLDNEETRKLDFHFNCLMLERKHQEIMMKKEEQKMKVNQLLNK